MKDLSDCFGETLPWAAVPMSLCRPCLLLPVLHCCSFPKCCELWTKLLNASIANAIPTHFLFLCQATYCTQSTWSFPRGFRSQTRQVWAEVGVFSRARCTFTSGNPCVLAGSGRTWASWFCQFQGSKWAADAARFIRFLEFLYLIQNPVAKYGIWHNSVIVLFLTQQNHFSSLIHRDSGCKHLWEERKSGFC